MGFGSFVGAAEDVFDPNRAAPAATDPAQLHEWFHAGPGTGSYQHAAEVLGPLVGSMMNYPNHLIQAQQALAAGLPEADAALGQLRAAAQQLTAHAESLQAGLTAQVLQFNETQAKIVPVPGTPPTGPGLAEYIGMITPTGDADLVSADELVAAYQADARGNQQAYRAYQRPTERQASALPQGTRLTLPPRAPQRPPAQPPMARAHTPPRGNPPVNRQFTPPQDDPGLNRSPAPPRGNPAMHRPPTPPQGTPPVKPPQGNLPMDRPPTPPRGNPPVDRPPVSQGNSAPNRPPTPPQGNPLVNRAPVSQGNPGPNRPPTQPNRAATPPNGYGTPGPGRAYPGGMAPSRGSNRPPNQGNNGYTPPKATAVPPMNAYGGGDGFGPTGGFGPSGPATSGYRAKVGPTPAELAGERGMAGLRGGRRTQDRDSKSALLQENNTDDLFGTDEKTVPPVIGG